MQNFASLPRRLEIAVFASIAKKVLTASKGTMPKKKPGVYTAKNGAKYKILPNGKARFISGPTKRGGGKKKGGGMHHGKKGGGMMGKKGGGMGSKTQHIIY